MSARSSHPFRLPVRKIYSTKKRAANTSLVFFHYSRLDWRSTKNDGNRKSTKGNDRFIRAFVKAINDGLNARCVILRRGKDCDLAQKLIREIGGEKYFEWRESLSLPELVEQIERSDIVVDQFDIGGFGAGAIEAMALAKPIMIYLDMASLQLSYDEGPPVLNCRTEPLSP